MININNQTDFLTEIKKQTEIIIYGAGWAGKLMHDFLKIYGIRVSAFAVTKLQNDEKIEQICVLALDDALQKYSNAFIILAVLSDKQKEMRDLLDAKSVINYCVLPEIVFYEIRREILKQQADNWKFDSRKRKDRFVVGYLYPGYLDTNYAEQRLVKNAIAEADYIPLPKVPGKIPGGDIAFRNKSISYYKTFSEALYCPEVAPSEIDLIHVFNAVCITDRPWIASFETYLPRVMPLISEIEKAYFLQLAEYIMKDNCKGILALCEMTYNIQCKVLRDNLPSDMAEKIIKKMKIAHPPQEILISDEQFDKKHALQQIHFLFIGHGFFFKGGREIINALSQFESNYDFRLTIISSLQTNDYFTHASDSDKLKIQKIIETKKWIDYYESLPNSEVLEICRQAAVGLLPSFADTYGYSVLEMQAAGCPVVTTNVRAFPEINNEECGWLCTLPVNVNGTCDKNKLSELSEQLEKQLVECLGEIFRNPQCVKEKGRKALDKIRQMHDPKTYSDSIRSLIC